MAVPFSASARTMQQNGYRIGMFSESFHPVQNGVSTSVLTLIAGLRALNHHICVFAPAHEHQPVSESNVLRFPSFVSAFNREYPVAYPFLPRIALETHFDRLKLDVVHTHTPFVMGLTGGKLAIRRNVPLVSTFHTLYAQYTHYVPLLPDSMTQSLVEHYLPWYYNRCTEIICPSEVAAQTLRGYGVTRPITVIPTGVPLPPREALTETARRQARKRIGVSFHAPLLVYAGRIAREKNIDWLLEVFGKVHSQVPAARLAIVGGGSYLEEAKSAASSFGDSVLFPGPTPRHQLDELFAACDVFCFPSASETQGLVIGEARAAGAPCVVADAGGAPETVRDGEDGFRVPCGDTAAFAARVVQLLTNPELRATMRANARANALAYTPERMVQNVLGVYERARSHHHDAPTADFSTRTRHDSDTDNEMDWETVSQSLIAKLKKP